MHAVHAVGRVKGGREGGRGVYLPTRSMASEVAIICMPSDRLLHSLAMPAGHNRSGHNRSGHNRSGHSRRRRHSTLHLEQSTVDTTLDTSPPAPGPN